MRKKSGFTIMELLVVIAIVAIMVSIGVPSLINWRQKAHLGKAARGVYAGLQKAKMEATRNNRVCVFNFSQITVNGVQYGFHLFIDRSNPLNFDYDAGVDTFITGFRTNDYPGVFLDTAFGDANGLAFLKDTAIGVPVLAFAPDGLPRKRDGSLSSGSLYFHDGGKNGRQISVSPVGRIQISQYEAN